MNFNQNVVSKRFVEIFYSLKEKKIFTSQQEAAEKLEFSPNSLSDILKGKRDVTIELLRKFFITYNINPSSIFDSEVIDKKKEEELVKLNIRRLNQVYQRIVDIYVINKTLGFNTNFKELDPIAKLLAKTNGIDEGGILKRAVGGLIDYDKKELESNINLLEDFFVKKFKELFYNISVEYPKIADKPLKKKK